MKKFITAVALTAALVPMAYAGQLDGRAGATAEGLGHRAGADKIFAQLNLTAEQKAQIKAIRETDRQQNQALYQSVRAKFAEYRQLKQANAPAADAAKAALVPLAEQARAARKATRESILNVLTPEQRAQLSQLRASARSFGHGFAAGHRMGVMSQLNLTAEQKQQMKALREADRQQNQALYQSVRAKAAGYRQLKQANDPKADAAKADLQALRTQAKAARTAEHDKMLSLLTPEQRALLEQLRAQRKSQH
jgi:protein CpxP